MRTLLLFLISGLLCGSVAAQAPLTLHYQGYLTTPGSGAPVNGSVALSFRLYDAPTGGSLLYTEGQTVTVTNGVFDAVIGTLTPIALPFTAQYYLGVAVGNNDEMTPRQPLTSVGSALHAGMASGLDCTGCVTASQLAQGVAISGPTGANGRNALVAMTAEPAGANCAYGGTKVTSGTDLDGGGTLDAGEITATRYVCNGGPFAVVPSAPPGCGTSPLTLGTPTFISPAGLNGVVYRGDALTLSVGVTNPNTCNSVTVANNYQWTLLAKPLGSSAALSNPNASSPTLVADIAGGSYQFSVQVIDTLGNKSPTAFVTVNVSACGGQAPVFSVTSYPSPVYTSTVTQFGLQVTSPDNQNASPGSPNYCPPRFAKTFSYEWSIQSAPAGGNAQLSTATAAAPFFSSGTVPGAYIARVVVTDSTGLPSAPAQLPITVALCGTAPLSWPAVNAIVLAATDPDPSSPQGQVNVGTQVALTPNPTEPNACPGAPVSIGYQWALLAAPAGSGVKLVSDNAGVARFVPDKPGTYQFQVVATDSLGNTSPAQLVSVTTSNCGANPVSVSAQAAGFSPPLGTAVGTPATVLVSSANAIGLNGGTALSNDNSTNSCPSRFATSFSYAWSIVNAPPGTTAQLTNVNGTTTTFNAGTMPGDYQVQVIAQGGSSGISSAPSFVFFKVN